MNIVITGASSGIGFATALQLSQSPYHYILAVSRNEEKLAVLKKQADTLYGNGNILPLVLDIERQDFSALAKQMDKLGEIDVLINNAGLLLNKPFLELTDADWLQLYQVNVLGAVHTIKAVLPYMGKNRRGHIVNIGSMGGYQGSSKFRGLAAYSASKAALANLTECLAEELHEQNIAVNCLALGAVQTEMLHQAFPDYTAPVTSQEMANYIAFFATHGQLFQNGKIVPLSLSTP
jgi:NAD(P)-dependent dehydrogenase (short-subunit alcohol dehydrogenase family)